MSHRLFAELENNTVINIIAVDEDDCLDENGQFSEQIGASFLQEVYRNGQFIETRHDASVRRFSASIGGTYLPDLDQFRPRKPDEGFEWDDEQGKWIDPNFVPPTDEEIAVILAQMEQPDPEN